MILAVSLDTGHLGCLNNPASIAVRGITTIAQLGHAPKAQSSTAAILAAPIAAQAVGPTAPIAALHCCTSLTARSIMLQKLLLEVKLGEKKEDFCYSKSNSAWCAFREYRQVKLCLG